MDEYDHIESYYFLFQNKTLRMNPDYRRDRSGWVGQENLLELEFHKSYSPKLAILGRLTPGS